MTRKYHVRDDGNPGRCTASEGNCPFGESAPHYDSPEAARKAYEESKATESFAFLKAPTRARTREKFGTPKNLFRRAALDSLYSDNAYSLMESWRYIVRELDGKCYLCGREIYDKKTGREISDSPRMKATADHIVPPGEGGSITPGNLAPAHQHCNAKRGDTPIQEYLKDKPEMLALVERFQKRFGFAPPAKEEIQKINSEIDDIWAEALAKVEALKAKHAAAS